ncbi:MAG TPA: hypothetical protein VFU86_19340 [Terriglobales bacterium]|nr:hypothetical protein [Terriglobales bacterium]
MTTFAKENKTDLPSVLSASGRSPEIPESADVYGWLIGDWELEVFDHRGDGTVRRSSGEAHFGWVLEGRAVQDVWIMPRIVDRKDRSSKEGNRYGTTLRVWDPTIQAWRATWINPVSGRRDELVGRRIGNDIIQIGTHDDGRPIRWNFTEVANDSFRWTGEVLSADGKTWTLEAEFHGRRIK